MDVEHRYLVFKLSDLDAYAPPAGREQLTSAWQTMQALRRADGKPPLECVVVERDWPEYRPTVDAITRRVRQARCEHDWTWHPIAGEGQYCRHCGVRNFDCDD